jgi:hypothetical protein
MTPNLKRSKMNLSEKIDLYLDGLLTNEERKAIEKKIEEDPEFAMQVQDLKKLDIILSNLLQYTNTDTTGIQDWNSHNQSNGISDKHEIFPPVLAGRIDSDLAEKLNSIQKLEIHDDLYKYHDHYSNAKNRGEEKLARLVKSIAGQNERSKHRNVMSILNIAASLSLVIIITTGIFYLIKEKRMNKNHELIFTTYFHPEADPGLNPIISQAGYSSYDEVVQKYKIRGGRAENILRNNEQTNFELLIKAILYIEPENYNQATDYLSIAMESYNSEISEASKWYYALILIKNNDLQNALSMLNQISSSESLYSNRAKQLIERLSPS